jgi:hypothetical protein
MHRKQLCYGSCHTCWGRYQQTYHIRTIYDKRWDGYGHTLRVPCYLRKHIIRFYEHDWERKAVYHRKQKDKAQQLRNLQDYINSDFPFRCFD